LDPVVERNLVFQQLCPLGSGAGNYFPAIFYHSPDYTFPEKGAVSRWQL